MKPLLVPEEHPEQTYVSRELQESSTLHLEDKTKHARH